MVAMVSPLANNSNALPRLLLAVLLVLAQSLALAHEQDHSRSADTSICDICVAAQSLDGGQLAAAEALNPRPAASTGESLEPGTRVQTQCIVSYRTRAPPAPCLF